MSSLPPNHPYQQVLVTVLPKGKKGIETKKRKFNFTYLKVGNQFGVYSFKVGLSKQKKIKIAQNGIRQ